MNRKSGVQVWAEFAAAKALFSGLGLLPRRGASAVAGALSQVSSGLLGGLWKTGLRNLEIAYPEMGHTERARLLRGTFANLGRVLADASQSHKSKPADISRLVDFELDDYSRELWARSKKEKRGVVVTTGHLGNWELLVTAFAALHQPIAYLARPIDNPKIEEMTMRMRTRFGNRPLNKTNSVMTAMRLLRAGEIVGVLADVNAHPKEGVFVPFFGVDACTTAGPATLAIRTSSFLFPIFCVFDHATRRYKIVHGEAMEPVSTGDREADIVATTAAFTAQIESIIRKYPDQWLWIHKRWKTRPKGEKAIY